MASYSNYGVEFVVHRKSSNNISIYMLYDTWSFLIVNALSLYTRESIHHLSLVP